MEPTLDSIVSDVLGELGDPAPNPEPAAPAASGEDGGASGEAPATAPTGDEGGAAAQAEADFLAASGVTLEDLLEGIDDADQRSFIERRYKEMQAHFSRRTQEVAAREKAQQATESETVAELRKRLEELENGTAQRQEPAAVAPEEFRRRFATQGLGDLVTVEDAITDPQKFEQFTRQQAIIAARENGLEVIEAVDRRIAALERIAYETTMRESKMTVQKLFENAPEYQTPENTAAITALMQANPRLSLEQAFEVVVGPQQREGAYRLGQRVGEVAGRRTEASAIAQKQRVSVPSSASGATGGEFELPARPTLDDAFEFARRTIDGR